MAAVPSQDAFSFQEFVGAVRECWEGKSTTLHPYCWIDFNIDQLLRSTKINLDAANKTPTTYAAKMRLKWYFLSEEMAYGVQNLPDKYSPFKMWYFKGCSNKVLVAIIHGRESEESSQCVQRTLHHNREAEKRFAEVNSMGPQQPESNEPFFCTHDNPTNTKQSISSETQQLNVDENQQLRPLDLLCYDGSILIQITRKGKKLGMDLQNMHLNKDAEREWAFCKLLQRYKNLETTDESTALTELNLYLSQMFKKYMSRSKYAREIDFRRNLRSKFDITVTTNDDFERLMRKILKCEKRKSEKVSAEVNRKQKKLT